MAVPNTKTAIIFDHLKRCADEMRTVTYGELAKEAGIAAKNTGPHLGYIRDNVCCWRA